MARGRFAAYYRASTQRQGRSGLGLEAQRKAIVDHLNGGSWELIAEFTETESGKRNDRPELARVIELCRKQKATLLIAKLDRLARNVQFISGLMESKVNFVAVDMPQANRRTVHILAAVAEHEREVRSARIKAGLAATKARGKRLGWSNPTRREECARATARASVVKRERADRFAANVLPIVRQIQQAGVDSLNGIASALNARGVRTARGGSWHASTVRNIVAREAVTAELAATGLASRPG